MNAYRVLVTGGSGYLGSALLRYLSTARPEWHVYSTFRSRPIDSPHAYLLDLRDNASIERVMLDSRPGLVVHTAAEMLGSRDALLEVNAAGSGAVARLARELGARLIHLSSDVIFDGRRGSYREEDEPNPLTPYGESKFEAERAVLDAGGQAVIVRTSLIYGFSPVDQRTRAMLDGQMARLFTDEMRCPIHVENLCEALVELADSNYEGILHVAGTQALSRYDFGVRIVRALGGDDGRLIAMRSEDRGLVRPKDCTLDCSRAQAMLRTRLLGVDDVLVRESVRKGRQSP